MSAISRLQTALSDTGLAFAHFGWNHAPSGDFGVYAEDGEETLFSDSKHSEAQLTGYVDYFTRTDGGTAKDKVEEGLADSGLLWWLNSIQYEQDTGFIHYEWRWRDIG